MKFSKQYDFLGIGDTVVDAFIRLEQAEVRCNKDKENCYLCLKFADKILYENVYIMPAVGNSANAAVAASRLGLNSALFTNFGGDSNGKDCLKILKAENIDTDFVVINKDRKTNYHYVLWAQDDRTILVKHEKYAYSMIDINDPRWVYLSSLGESSLEFHRELSIYLNEHPNIKLAFQPGTFQMKFGKESLKGIYKRSNVFFCNKEEAQRILENQEHDIKELLKMMLNLGPKIVVITDGVKGAYSYDGNEMLFMRPYPDPKPPLERTGAGDAFSSTFTVALALGMSIRDALKWAPINPMSVVQEIGARAGLLTRPELEEYLRKAPADYEPKVIN